MEATLVAGMIADLPIVYDLREWYSVFSGQRIATGEVGWLISVKWTDVQSLSGQMCRA